jgi:hypothetical protein
MRLKIQLQTNWVPVNDNDGPATFCRQESGSAFQISWGEYVGEQKLRKLDTEELKQQAASFGQQNGWGELVESSFGQTGFGSFGSSVFRSATHPHMQLWLITDGNAYMLATHICDRVPGDDELAEVRQIVDSLSLGKELPKKKPKWKFW